RRLLCWGDNQYGQVGVGSLVNRTIPSPVASGGQWVDVSVGEWFACGVREGGQVPRERYCWGRSPALGLGQLSRSESKVTVPTTISDGSWSTVTTGAYHACGISVNRRAYCWGS